MWWTHFKWCVQFLNVDNCGVNLYRELEASPFQRKWRGSESAWMGLCSSSNWALGLYVLGPSLPHYTFKKKKKNCLFKKRPPTLVPAPRVWFWKLINELEKDNELAFWFTLLLTLSSPVLFKVLVKSFFLSLLSCSLFSLVFIIESPEFSPLIPISN